MSITIQVEDMTEDNAQLLDPIEAFGAPHGTIFRMYDNGRPDNTYLIGAGHCERPISVWWDNECGQYRISSESKKDLKAFLPHIKIRECGPLSRVRLSLLIEDYEA